MNKLYINVSSFFVNEGMMTDGIRITQSIIICIIAVAYAFVLLKTLPKSE